MRKGVKGNDTYGVEDMEGPTEIVIWKDFSNLLEEQPEGSRKRTTKRKRKSKNKRKKTKRSYVATTTL